jgi:hypothetical protein
LEFRDGMIPFRQMVDMIEPSYVGIAEICACAPMGLQDLIKSRAPASLVKVSQSTLSSGLWMHYYGYFLAAFEPGPISFGEVGGYSDVDRAQRCSDKCADCSVLSWLERVTERTNGDTNCRKCRSRLSLRLTH